MARQGANTNDRWYRRYNKVYARTQTFQSRRGRRTKDSSQFITFRGLNTVTDDFNVSKMTSPYMINWRFANERIKEQGSQLISRTGTKYLNSYGTKFTDIKPEDQETTIELSTKVQVKTKHNSGTDLVVGGSIRLRNRSGAKGHLLIHYIQNNKTICSAEIDLAKVGYEFENKKYRLIGGVKGEFTVRYQIIDEFNLEYEEVLEDLVIRPIEIAGTAKMWGYKAENEIPFKDEALKEKKLDWQITSSVPLLGKMINNVKFFGDLIEVVVKNIPYLIFVADDGKSKRIGRFNLDNNDIDFFERGFIAENARSFSGVLVDGKITFVDGVSRLKYIDVRDWSIHTANPENTKDLSGNDIDNSSLKAPEGFKYICLINNRIYLANLPDSPNYVTYSMIDRSGAKYFNFHDKFYSPNIATYDSRTTPITGLVKYTEKSLAIWREDGMSIFSAPNGFEFGGAQQQDSFSNEIGVAEINDLANYNGSIYFFNKSEGFRRFSGATATVNSAYIDTLIRRIPEDSKRLVYVHAGKVHLQVDDYQLVFDLSNSQSVSPWLMDTQRYIYRTYTEQKSDRLWASHNQYLVFMELDADDVYKDFDCAIPCEYQTHYTHSPDTTGDMIVHKMMAHLAKMSDTTWHIGFDRNHADNPSVWTKVLFKHKDKEDEETDIFDNTNNDGATMVNIGLHAKCYVGQIRVSAYAYNNHIGILALAMETQNVEAQ